MYGDQARFFEAEKVPRIKHKKKGTVSMVNNGGDQHGSQVCPQIWKSHVNILGHMEVESTDVTLYKKNKMEKKLHWKNMFFLHY